MLLYTVIYSGRSADFDITLPDAAGVPCVAGCTYSPRRIRALGRMKRRAWAIVPAAISSCTSREIAGTALRFYGIIRP